MIVIRCDSSYQIGTGHIYRDLSLAQQLRVIGFTVIFCCKDLPGNISDKVKDLKFEVHILGVQTNQVEEIDWIKSQKPSWVVIDHYGIDTVYESEIKKIC
jgi:UDP-2,4-diacetamido-2,4,6-trideoxy-beta-L-altropyranose hydrolase